VDYFRDSPVKAFGDIKTPWSLAAPIGYYTNAMLVDTVSEGLW